MFVLASCCFLLLLDDPALVAGELHAAERAALVEVADRIGLQLRLLGHGVLAEVLALAGRAIAQIVGAVVVPPGALIVGGAIEDFEMDRGMFKADAAELNEILGLEPDRQPAVIQRLLAEIADPQARDLEAVFVGIERAGRFAKGLADAIAAVGTRRDVG